MRVGSVFGESPVYIRLICIMWQKYCLANSPSTAISQSLWVTTGTTLKPPPGRVAEHLAEIYISYQHIIILRASYIMVS